MFRHAKSLIDAAASGAWARHERLCAYAALLIGAYVLASVALVLTGEGITDHSGRLIGTDFGMIWSAGRTALAGRADEVFSLAAQAIVQRDTFGEAAGFTPWHYPPTFLLVAAPLAALPYFAALAVWQAATFSGYLIGLRACAPRGAGAWALLLGASFPAAFINAVHGQNGFLTAALMTGGVLLLTTRPVMAGVLFALLSYKPQFCVLIPVLLLAQGDWRAIAAAIFAGCALLLVTHALFGFGVFEAFLASLTDAKRLTMETGATGWEKIQSVFGGVRLMGGGYELAMLVQVVVALLVIAAIAFVWRSQADARLKQALVFPGVLLTTPYCLDYDLVLLAPALVLLAMHGMSRGFARWEIGSLTGVFITPMIARVVGGATHAPLGALAMLALFAWVLRRAVADARAARLQTADVRTSPARPPLSETPPLSP
jgi:alpha-1,2-mannosyltransferase